MENIKVKKILKKILLENEPKEYCSSYNGEFNLWVNYKDSRIHISHYPLYETKKVRGWFCSRDEKIKTDRSITYVYIYPNSGKINSLYFRFENNEVSPWLEKYVERYDNREINKQYKFLNSLCGD